MILEARTEREQEAIGGALARVLPPHFVIYLEGNLGSGKTTLIRGMLRGLGFQGAVKSPTYTLMEPYAIDGRHIYHFDLYRLADPEELEYIGLRDLLTNDAVLCIEWPDHGAGELPAADLAIHIAYQREGRSLNIEEKTPLGAAVLERFWQINPLNVDKIC